MLIQWTKKGSITCVKQYDEDNDAILDEEMYGINVGDVDEVDIIERDDQTGFVD